MRDYPDGLPGYDAWKLATPPEYDEPGPEFDCEACEDSRECRECGGKGGWRGHDSHGHDVEADCGACDGTGQCPECSDEVDDT